MHHDSGIRGTQHSLANKAVTVLPTTQTQKQYSNRQQALCVSLEDNQDRETQCNGYTMIMQEATSFSLPLEFDFSVCRVHNALPQ